MAIPDPSTGKAGLRTTMRRHLKEVGHDPSPALAALEVWLARHPQLRTIAVYAALPGEIDLIPTLQKHPEIRWVFPRVEGDRLVFHAVDDHTTGLQPGAFGIREPALDLTETPPHEIDAFICPGLAFDPRGGRLGRGRGFYDRLLATARPDAFKVGICFQDQMVEDTFAEIHDVHMDEVLV